MSKDGPIHVAKRDVRANGTAHPEEAEGLLENTLHTDLSPPSNPTSSSSRTPQLRQSSIIHMPGDGAPRTPRTANRVRFEFEEQRRRSGEDSADDNGEGREWEELEEEDYLSNSHVNTGRRRRGQRTPLLTDIEAPSVTLATSGGEGDWIASPGGEGVWEERPKSGMRAAFMNMANSIIGAGIIGQPYAFRQAGLATGVLLLVGLTITVDWTIRLIVVNSKLSGANSFQATMEHCFGRTGLIAISIAQWAFAFGGMVAFCIIVGDSIPHVLTALFPSLRTTPVLWLLTNRKAIIILFVLGISYPLSLYRDIAKLAKASTLALISMVVIIITVITQGFRVPTDLKGNFRGSLVIRDGVFQAIGVISFAFVCHHNSLLIYGSLKKPTLDRFARVTHYSTSISMVACLTMALAGFLTFGDKTMGNVLNNFPNDNIMVNIARFCFGLNMLTTLPLECFVCREVMENYYFPTEPFHPNRHLIFTSSLVVSAMTLSLLTCDLGAVFELIGATSACALAYILPPLCYIKLSTRSWKTVPAIACVVFGVAVMFISLFQAVAKIIRNEGGTQVCR